jgi:hypothetical protein
MSDVLTGRPVSPQSVTDIAYVINESRRQAAHFGSRGQTLHRQATGRVTAALVAQRRRNAFLGLPLDNLLGAPSALVGEGVRATAQFGHHQLMKFGLSKENADQLTDLGVAGLQLGIAALTGSFAGAIPAIAASAAVSGALNKSNPPPVAAGAAPATGSQPALPPSSSSPTGSGSAALAPAGATTTAPLPRNLGFLSFKTPGAILAEIETADAEIRGLSADVNDTFRAPFEEQLKRAMARFEKEHGFKPGVGAGSDPGRDFAQVYAWMTPVPTKNDIASKGYQGSFLEQFGAFTGEWLAFAADHRGWTDRFWGSGFDKAQEFRQRAVEWRKRFVDLGGVPTAPDPIVPPPDPDPSFPWGKVIAIASIGAAAVVAPHVLRTIRAGKSPSIPDA